MINIKSFDRLDFSKLNFKSINLVYLNTFLILLPFIFSLIFKLKINYPPDTDSYFNFFDNLSSIRTIGLPFLLSISLGENKILKILQVNIFAIIFSIISLKYYLIKYSPIWITNNLQKISSSVLLSIFLCPWAIFSLFQTLSDFSYTLISSSILISLITLLSNFKKNKIKYAFLDTFALGILFGLSTLIRPVGTFLPLFILLIYLLTIIKDIILKNFIFSSIKIMKNRKRIFSLLLVFLLSSTFVQSINSINTFQKFGTYNYLSISSVNMKCWREIHASKKENDPKKIFASREECILNQGTNLPSNNFMDNFKSYLSVNTLIGSLRMSFDNDYISYLSLLGIYTQPDRGDASSIDFLYTFKFKNMITESISPRIKLVYPFFAFLILSFISTILFWFHIFLNMNKSYVSVIFSSNTSILLLSIIMYYVIVMSGSDTAGRYGLPITFLLTLSLSFSAIIKKQKNN